MPRFFSKETAEHDSQRDCRRELQSSQVGVSSVRVRPAEPPDLPRLVEIASHSVTAAQWNQAEYQKLFAADQPQLRTALVMEQDGSVAGFIIGRQADEEWEIENIAVTGSARRCGLGSRLVGELLDLVRSRGGTSVFLEVRESNRAARSLYEKWAFIEVGRRKMYYQNPAEDALILKFKFP
ncbi:MAG TPA: ribosomal protein S18-alanine N-acetyltransferase [Candidatus Dormibacteraeota bacterium]|jgi:ribosomal-protein-alanine N-acetyltransferase|nr:ribosomal protein S18-alanine N-acetyltransferase [Candidatus Dormibacteraeota bacterium]